MGPLNRILRHSICTLLVAVGVTWTASTSARAEENGARLFVAGGLGWGLGSVRLGLGPWEGGLLNSRALGIDKRWMHEKRYASFGFVLMPGLDAGVGLYAGVGHEEVLFWKIHFRGELNGVVAHTGHAYGELQAGLSLNF